MRYFVDALPADADRAMQNALDGEAVLELPAIAAAESMYIAYNRDAIAGRSFRGAPEDVVAILRSDVPIVLAPTDLNVLVEVLDWQGTFPRQLHDAMIVASHVVSGTDAVITSDERIPEVVPTVWE